MKPWTYCMSWTSGKCCDIDAHWIGKKNVNSRHLYLCVLRCVTDRVISDFLLSLTVTSIDHDLARLFSSRWFRRVSRIVANAAPTFFTHLSLSCFWQGSLAPLPHPSNPSHPKYSLLKINLWLMMLGQEMIWNLLTLYKGEGGAFI